MKSYKDMKYSELVCEYNRILNLLKTNKNIFTQKQNRKYLKKIEDRINEF